jgi:hypothetical protein
VTQLLQRAAMALPLSVLDLRVTQVLAQVAPRAKGQACVAECASVHSCGFVYCCAGNDCYFGNKYCDDCGGQFCYSMC